MVTAFRPDIEGLRALAVVPILLFHVSSSWCPGGYIGVDIFLVISGYLITRMILADGDRFSFKAFYVRRFFRLFPALFATLIGTLAAGWAVLGPQDFVRLAQSAMAAAFGVSNVFFFHAVDYFNASAFDHPLLHTWSLGVEEQFYLVWPALLMLALSRRWPLLSLALVAGVLSVVAVVLVRPVQPELVFYMMPFRMAEFAIGAAALAIERQWERLPDGASLVAGGAAVGALAYSFAMFDGHTPWPGAAALLPCLATAALILAGASGFWSRVLSSSVLRFLGRISYSLYLVHWPLIALYRHRVVTEPGAAELAMLAIGSIVLAWLLYALIETPFRITGSRATRARSMNALEAGSRTWHVLVSPLTVPRWFAGPAVVLSGALVLIASTVVWASNGFPSRLDRARVQFLDQGLPFAGDLCDHRRSRCLFGDREAQQTVYLVGDSHALNLLAGLDQLFKQERIKGVALYDHGCLFVKDTVRFSGGVLDKKCKRNVEEAYALLASNQHPVILVGSYAGYRGTLGSVGDGAPLKHDESAYHAWLATRLAASLDALQAGQRPVILFKSSYVTGVHLPKCLAQPGLDKDAQEHDRKCAPLSLGDVQARFGDTDQMIDAVARSHARVTVIEPKTIFCATSGCQTRSDAGLFFRDTEHLTVVGSEFLIGRARADLLKGIGGR